MKIVLKWLGMVLWLAGAVSLILAWTAVAQRGLIFGLEPLAWYWNALIFGVLSLGAKFGPQKQELPSESM